MSNQSYPWVVRSQLSASEDMPRPASLRNAVYVMCVAAGVALLGASLTLADESKLKAEIFNRVRANGRGKGGYTIPQLHTVASVTFAGLVIAGFVSVALWLWLAWALGRSRGWARTCSSVLFGLLTVEIFFSLSRGVSIIFILVEWLLGLAAIVLLWRRETTAYLGAG